MRFVFSSFCLACVPLVIAQAQTAAIGVPRLGFALDPTSNRIRPIDGIPGAAMLGDAADAASGFSYAAISPRHDLALGVSVSDRQLYLVRLPGDGVYPISGATPAPSRIVFSPAGRAAVVVGEHLQILTGLPSSPTLVDLAVPPSVVDIGAIAISEDAQQILIASKAGESDVAWLLIPGTAPVPLRLSGPVAAAAFGPEGHNAAAVTLSGDIYLIRNPGADAEVRLVHPGDEQSANPVAIRLAGDGNRAYVANARGVLSSVDLLTGSAVTAMCECLPTGLFPMRSDALFRITEISDRPMMLFDASDPAPRVWFVPPDSAGVIGQRSAQ